MKTPAQMQATIDKFKALGATPFGKRDAGRLWIQLLTGNIDIQVFDSGGCKIELNVQDEDFGIECIKALKTEVARASLYTAIEAHKETYTDADLKALGAGSEELERVAK